jgi:hypothetical protein
MHRQLIDEPFVIIDDRGSVRSLVQIDPDHEHQQPPRSEVKRRRGHS